MVRRVHNLTVVVLTFDRSDTSECLQDGRGLGCFQSSFEIFPKFLYFLIALVQLLNLLVNAAVGRNCRKHTPKMTKLQKTFNSLLELLPFHSNG